MCWITYKKELIKPEVAEDNIVCNKLVYLHPNNIIESIHFSFKYKINVLYELDKETSVLNFINGINIIEYGFHSYTTDIKFDLQRGLKEIPYMNIHKKPYALASCIIPKGARYFLNEYGEYVSNKIKMLSVFRIEG